MTYEVPAVVEQWIADRKLPRRKLAFLQREHELTIECMGSASFPIADGHSCGEVQIPQGSYWCQVVAELLDHLDPPESRTDRRQLELSKALEECNQLPADWWDEWETLN
jgi:hypothetical protein